MYSASHGFNAVYNGIQQRYAERKQIMNVVRKHEDKSKKRKAKKNKKKNHQSVDSDSDPLTNDESDDYMRNTVDDDDQIVTPVEPVSNLDITMPQPQLLQQPDNNLSNLTKSSNKKKKSNKNIIQQVITGHKPGDDGTSQVRDILVYNIPGLKSFKIIQTAKGDHKLISYFEKWVDMRTALDNQFDWERLHLSWNQHDSPLQRTRSFGNNTNKDRQRTSGSRQTDKSKQNSKNSKKKPQEAKSEKHKKQKKDKSHKTS
ncbi:unnamed protein product [Rhizophagus irregularis]|nr:unnamed protein product [Rhizophagus irregularis]